MTNEPFIAHSELTNEIYIVQGRNKYRVTEQAIHAVKAIIALEQEPKTGHWNEIPKYKDIAWQCSECEHFTTWKHNFCPNCGVKMEQQGEKP